MFMVFGGKIVFGFLHAKPCRIIWKFPQQINFGSETCEIWPKVGTWTCPSCPKVSKWGRNPPKKHPSFLKRQQNQFLKSKSLLKNNRISFLKRQHNLFFCLTNLTKDLSSVDSRNQETHKGTYMENI